MKQSVREVQIISCFKKALLAVILLTVVLTVISSCGGGGGEGGGDGTVPNTIPEVPQNVAATGGNGQVRLSWESVTVATSYQIYWSTTPGVNKESGTKISHESNVYYQSDLTNNTTYYYVVTAANQYGESTESQEVSATPSSANPPLPPAPAPSAPTIAAENQKTGNPASEWEVSGSGDPSIQGFATDFSVNHGETISFKIKSTATAYRIDIYRLGYYGGLGARKVATLTPSVSLPQNQPACMSDTSTKLVDCGNWAVSASWAVPSDATSGVYIARPVRSDTGGASHIVFVVRDDEGKSDILFQTGDATWQAFNQYGGSNLYRTGSSTDGTTRAYKVSYNRPFINRGSTTQFFERETFLFNTEYPMIRWLEANGYDVSYASAVDTDRRGAAALQSHKVFLSVGHDEYVSAGQRANVEAARAAGVHLGFFTGNEYYWKTRWENNYRTLVCYHENWAPLNSDPSSEWTGMWRDVSPENALTGQWYAVDAARYDPIRISSSEGKLRFWRNTGIDKLADGQTAQLAEGMLGFEWDEVRDNGYLPAGLFRLSTTKVQVDTSKIRSGYSYSPPGVVTHNLTLYRHSSGALVFGAGTIQWSWGLDAYHDISGPAADSRMQQATVNLFADMGVQPATLQSGLVAATQSTDTVAPKSVILTPSDKATVSVGVSKTISGTATDEGGGKPAGVEYSVDGGATWHPADGTENWTATWTPGAAGQTTIKSRAVDDSGRIESPGAGITVTVY